MKKWIIICGSLFVILLLYFSVFNIIEPTEIGIARNKISGDTWKQEGGMYITPPWVFVVRVDLRPIRVSVPSAGRGYTAKLVQFEKQHWENFVLTEGLYYYWWANRLSFNIGYHEEHRGFKDIMRGYAYNAHRYPFITVLKEYNAE